MIQFIRKFKDQFKVPIIQYETFQYLLKLIELNSSVDELTPINYGLLQLCINHYQGLKISNMMKCYYFSEFSLKMLFMGIILVIIIMIGY